MCGSMSKRGTDCDRTDDEQPFAALKPGPGQRLGFKRYNDGAEVQNRLRLIDLITRVMRHKHH